MRPMLKSLKVTQLRRRRSVIQHGSFWWTKLIPSRIFYRLRPEHFRSCVNKMRLVPTVAYFSPNYISLRASLISSIIEHQSQRRFEQNAALSIAAVVASYHYDNRGGRRNFWQPDGSRSNVGTFILDSPTSIRTFRCERLCLFTAVSEANR